MPGLKQTNLNRSHPAAKKAGLGDALADCITAINALQAKHNALLAKLDADVGVTDVNYLTTVGVSAVSVVDLESRLTTT